jgi:hypothetical protein
MANPVKVENKSFIDFQGTKIELPKPVDQMTPNDWTRLAVAKKSPLGKIQIDGQSFQGLHVVLKDKNYLPIWAYAGTRRVETPRAFDTLERAMQMGAQFAHTDDLDERSAQRFELGADGHIHRDDVVLIKVPVVAYYALAAQNLRKSTQSIEYQSQESKAYEGIDMPHYVKGNKDAPLYETTEHTVQYQDRPRF